MAFINDLLDVWDLSELKNIFEENHINEVATLGELLKNQGDLATVVPCIGTRMKLKNKFNECLLTKCDVSNPTQKTQEHISVLVTEDRNSLTSREDEACASAVFNDNLLFDGIVTQLIEAPSEKPQTAEKKRHNKSRDGEPVAKIAKYALDVDIKNILEDHPLGPTIIQIYNHNQELDSQCRSYVCDIIVLHLLKNRLVPCNDDFEQLSNKIVEVFPNECKETYYVPPVKKRDSRNHKAGISKGKLVDKYRNKATFIRRAKNFEKQILSEDVTEDEIPEEILAADKSRTWLLHNRNENDVLRHWVTAYPLRASDCKNEKYKKIADIFDRWPILKEQKGYELIDNDFSTKYSSSSADLLIDGWETFFQKIIRLNEKKLSETDSLNAKLLGTEELSIDGRTAVQLHLLPRLVAPKSNKISIKVSSKESSRVFWKPSIVECREGLAVHVKVPGDIEHVVEEKRTKMSGMGLSVQPFIIIVGQDITKVEKVYVRMDSLMYEVPSLQKAIDIVFKIFLTFDLHYPLECEHICYLIQWGIYNIHTESDNKIPFVYTLLNKVKKIR